MKSVFLSASVPHEREPKYLKSANPFLIQTAVRELVLTVLGRRLLVWGGHPAITPMIWAACEDLDVSYSGSVLLYQSCFFKEIYPEENQLFQNVVYVPAVNGDRDSSLEAMRIEMLSSHSFSIGVFIGGMSGIVDEFQLFRHLQPAAKVLALKSPGGAAAELIARNSDRLGGTDPRDFAGIYAQTLGIKANERRNQAQGDRNGS